VQDVGGERLAVLRELQLELDTELLPYRSRLAEAHAKQPPAWLRPRAGVEDEELGALSTAARAFLARHRDRLTAAGLDLEPLLELHEAVVGRGQVEPPPEGPDMEADRMAIVEQRGRAGIAVAGEIDVATVPQLEQALSTRVDTAAEFHVDFSGVDFCDLRGLAAIIRVGRRLRRGRRLIVHGLPEALRRAMVIAGWDPQTMPWLVLTPEVTT
jgi:anti-anti-sigma factor